MPEGWREPVEVVDLEEEGAEEAEGEGFMREG